MRWMLLAVLVGCGGSVESGSMDNGRVTAPAAPVDAAADAPVEAGRLPPSVCMVNGSSYSCGESAFSVLTDGGEEPCASAECTARCSVGGAEGHCVAPSCSCVGAGNGTLICDGVQATPEQSCKVCGGWCVDAGSD